MIVDSSALLAIIFDEPDGMRLLETILDADRCLMSVANWFEATMVIDRRSGAAALSRFEGVLTQAEIERVPVTLAQADLARQAWLQFGRGAHGARLNFGDCFAYALAKEMREPLLFKGADFAHTDIEPALKD